MRLCKNSTRLCISVCILFPNKIKALTRYLIYDTSDTDTATTPLVLHVLPVVAVATAESWLVTHQILL
jgi:hypothetical protein